MIYKEQIALEDVSTEYRDFVDKFKPKKTTDDCYTPENVFIAIAEWAAKEYGFSLNQIVRPFYPGGDYESFNYPEGCIVLDNPPFSIISKICKFYDAHGVKYFLFAPSLTCLGTGDNCAIIADAEITYENGAIVNTSFLTNLDEINRVKSAPSLQEIIKEENKKNILKTKKELPTYKYPFEILTAAMVQKYSRFGIAFEVKREDCAFIREMEAQKKEKKTLFGGGLILSERAAAERAAAERAAAERKRAHVWELSENEKKISESLGK